MSDDGIINTGKEMQKLFKPNISLDKLSDNLYTGGNKILDIALLGLRYLLIIMIIWGIIEIIAGINNPVSKRNGILRAGLSTFFLIAINLFF